MEGNQSITSSTKLIQITNNVNSKRTNLGREYNIVDKSTDQKLTQFHGSANF